MASARRPNQGASASLQLPLTILIFIVLFSLVLYVAVVPDAGEGPLPTVSDIESSLNQKTYKQVAHRAEQKLRSTVKHKREQLKKACKIMILYRPLFLEFK